MYVRLSLKACGLLAVAALLGAPTCNQPFGPTSVGSGTAKKYSAFGDSIAAGYEATSTFPGQMKSYVGYYADLAAADRDWRITYRGITTSGETTAQIESRMRNNLSRVREADIFTWDAGGNDFLDARGDYYSNCNVGQLDNALDQWRGDWDVLLDTVEANAGTTAAYAPLIRTMNIYYPNPNQDRAAACSGQRSRFEVLLPRLLVAGDYMCSTAEARGWRCADSFAVMNCARDGNGNPAFNCPNKRYIQNLVDQGICPRNVTDPDYQSATIAVACITAHLDATGDWSAFRDPAEFGRIQTRDDIHPDRDGHIAIGEAHHDTGYDDIEGNLSENNYALCIDYEDNDGDGNSDCDDSGCAAYCN
ncbi:MAG: GDSL-type esterase/lipase family protein [Myxococcota bacterium]